MKQSFAALQQIGRLGSEPTFAAIYAVNGDAQEADKAKKHVRPTAAVQICSRIRNCGTSDQPFAAIAKVGQP